MNDSFIFVNLMGGMGNQLFQYAAGLLQKNETNGTLVLCKPHTNIHDTKDYRKILFNNENIHDGILPPHISLYQDDGFTSWNPSEWKYPIVYLYGYFQHYPTLKPILPHFKDIILNNLNQYKFKMLQKYTVNSSSIFIHVRHGDYIKLSNIFPIQTIDYYKKAYSKLSLSRNINKIFIFSDDMEWCKSQDFFKNLNPIWVEDSDPVDCLALMSEIKGGAIIANSTFSWMGAYLGCGIKPNTVIYPKDWFTGKEINLFPYEWVCV